MRLSGVGFEKRLSWQRETGYNVVKYKQHFLENGRFLASRRRPFFYSPNGRFCPISPKVK